MKTTIKITEIRHHGIPCATALFGAEKAQEVRRFHETLENYCPTPLRKLNALAAMLGVGSVYLKDESFRFGLNAFKGLGGSYAVHCQSRGKSGKLTFVTATDGNHGRGVAWAAARLGHEAWVYLPKGTAPERLKNILALGAHAEITDLSYDDTVRFAAKQAEIHGWLLIQDTAWEGYEEVPVQIMQGYTTMGLEITEQLGPVIPTHIFLQAGVGAMAGAMTAFFSDFYGDRRPKIIIAEPNGANCIFRTAEADDGSLHFCSGDMQTIMAGLCCGEPCTIGWNVLKDHADFVLSCPDATAADGMRILGNPLSGDPVIVSGESGAVTLGAAAEICRADDPVLREVLGIGSDSVLLCISTEGDTDRENYRDIVWYGKYSSL